MYLHDISCVFRTFICYILPLVTTAFYPRKGKIRENFYIETSHSRYKKLNATYLALHLGSYYKQNYHNGHSSCIFFHLALSHISVYRISQRINLIFRSVLFISLNDHGSDILLMRSMDILMFGIRHVIYFYVKLIL